MSKREGAIVTLDALLDDIGVDAARWYLASRSHDTSIDLDLELARSQSQDNPVYYVQYAHARIASILRKAGEERVAAALAADLTAATSASTRRRARWSSGCWSSRPRCSEAAERRAPHRMTTYAHETAQEFSAFYRDCRVVGAAEEGGDEDVRIVISRARQGRARALARPARSRGARRRCRVGAVRLALLAALASSLACAAPAAAVDRYVPMKVPPAPGPAKYDRVWVQQLGPKDADPGAGARARAPRAGRAAIMPVARDIVRRVPRTQVWIVDRRQQAFEDTSVFRAPRPGRGARLLPRLQVPPASPARTPSSCPSGGSRSSCATCAAWSGAPGAGGRKVILGGHSAGASTAVAYAAWDFGGQPGLPRDRRAGADRRRPARQLRRGQRRARPARARRHPQRQRVPRPARARPPRDRRDLRPGRRALRLRAPGRARRRSRRSRCCRPSSSRRSRSPTRRCSATRSTRPRRPTALELIQIRAGRLADERRPAPVAGRRADADPPLRPGVRRQRARTRPSGTTRAACCSTSTPPTTCA